jgi:hypothetical protein
MKFKNNQRNILFLLLIGGLFYFIFSIVKSPAPIDPLATKSVLFLDQISAQNRTVGEYLEDKTSTDSPLRQVKSIWNKMLHFLDMSDWVKASLLIQNNVLYPAIIDPIEKILFSRLADISIVMNYFLSSPAYEEPLNDHLKPLFREEYGDILFGWDNGKAPRLDILHATPNKIDHQTSIMLEKIHGLQSFFGILDRQNNLYQQPAYTAEGAPI